ncbi:MAG TPA: Rieske 2Fe-2S domain-containing protein [Streptosporangiaceae bacterium]
MSGTEDYSAEPPGQGEEAAPSGTPHRVIGTPPPAEQRTLLGTATQDSPPPAPRELPADPQDPVRAKRAERIVAALFILSMLAGIGFIAAYIGLELNSGGLDAVLRSNLALGLSMSVAFLALGVGAVIWVRSVMPNVEQTEQRKPLASKEADREAFAESFKEGTEASQFVKRPLLRRTLIAASIPLGLAPLVVLRDLGPLPGTTLRHTVWRNGLRLTIAGSNRPLKPADFDTPGGMITVIPEGYQNNDDEIAKAAVIIIKFGPGQLTHPTNMNWTVDNIVAYSKICTHVGCPVALYEQTTHHILCPCHQSTFDATTGATVLFGPAPRPLPQLPMGVDAEGYLIATHDFYEPVGPSFWERG